MKKGITPIIAIIVLLLITVALAGAAWTFLQGYLGTTIGSSFTIPTGGAFCVDQAGVNVITVQVTNTGQTTLSSPGDFTIAQVDGTAVNLSTVNIDAGSGEIVLSVYDCADPAPGDGCDSGPHTVTIGTSSAVISQPVTCP